MLKELFEKQNGIPQSESLNFSENAEQSVKTFDAIVDFLRDTESFSNKDINDLVTLSWRLIGNKQIPIVMDQWGVPSLTFAVLGEGVTRTPLYIMPTNFIDLVREDTSMQLGAVTYMASQGRDYYSGALERDGSSVVNMRAAAFEAETLLTLQNMAREEEMELPLNSYQAQILEKFPNGLADLAPNLHYPTPVYWTQNYRQN